MVGRGSSSSASQANVPFFNGEHFNLWTLMMKTMFRSRDLWNLVEEGFSEEEDSNQLNESMKKDAKALYLIQQALEPKILVRISETKTTKEVSEILKTEFQGDSDTNTIKLHSLHREYDAAKLKQGEAIQDFISRVLDIVFRIRVMGDQLLDKNMVAKILRSLTPRFSHVVHSIIEAKDLNTLTVKALRSSLKSRESILNLASEEEEKALHAKSSPFGEHNH